MERYFVACAYVLYYANSENGLSPQQWRWPESMKINAVGWITFEDTKFWGLSEYTVQQVLSANTDLIVGFNHHTYLH